MFLPGSIGAGACKEELKNAQARIMAAKAASQAQSADDALGETGGGSESSKTKDYLYPKFIHLEKYFAWS